MPLALQGSILPPVGFSSGDLIADRRYEYARGYLEAGDHAAAAELFSITRELAPDFIPALIGEADARIALGDPQGAASLLARVVELDPDGLFGASLKLAVLGAVPTPAHPPQAYVRGLFDDYADRFERALVDDLHYRAPWLIAGALGRLRPQGGTRGGFAHALDLGCGTGLMAEALAGRVERFSACDLSPEMVARARAEHRYDDVAVGDAVSVLTRSEEPLDLVTAADVFVYVGALGAVFAAVARRLAPGGIFAFSVEESRGEDLILRDSLRYAHGESYLRRLAAESGLTVATVDRGTLRLDRDQPIAGLIVVLER